MEPRAGYEGGGPGAGYTKILTTIFSFLVTAIFTKQKLKRTGSKFSLHQVNFPYLPGRLSHFPPEVTLYEVAKKIIDEK